MNAWSTKQRRLIAWFSVAVALLLPLGAQLHALSHALKAVAAHSEPLAPQAQTCDECLLYCALDTAMPAQAAAVVVVSVLPGEPLALVVQPRAAPFTAYTARAPPALA